MSWPVKDIPFTECDRMICQPGTYFELTTAVINGREERVWKNLHKSFRDLILESCAKFSDRQFLNAPVGLKPEPREDVTFGQSLEFALPIAAWLRAQGAKVGSTVGLVGYNSVNWALVFMAIHLIGAVPVMVNAAVQPDSMVHCLNLAKPIVIIADPPSASIIASKAGSLKDCGKLYTWSTDGLTNKVEVLNLRKLNMSAAAVRDIVSGTGLEDLHPESDAVVFFTSGTTGFPKAVISSQRAALHNIISAQITLGRAALRAGAPIEMVMPLISNPPDEQRIHLMVVPFFHATGALSILAKAFADGSSLVLMPRWNVDDAIDLIVRYKVNVVGGVPAIATALLQSPRLPKDLNLLGCSYGGSPPASRLAGDLNKRFPELVAGNGWGMTETNALHCGLAGMDYVVKPKSCGPVIPICEIRIVDQETRAVLPPNTVGTIETRGANQMKCYLNNPKATAEAVNADGWLDTGDAGFIDDAGCLSISDRIKDIIIRGGENIASEEVENAVFLDNRIAEVAAVSVPDDFYGELVAVAVSLAPGAEASAEDILAQVKPRLRGPARPAFVHVHHELLPRNVNGKLIKMDIKQIVREKYAQSKQEPRAKL